jgi:hypothetical protein
MTRVLGVLITAKLDLDRAEENLAEFKAQKN